LIAVIYIFDFLAFGIKDVTQKYTQEWGAKVVKYRIKGENEREWAALLSQFSRTWTDSKDKVEDEILKSSVISEKMPTSLKGFLNHPVYALEKQLKKNEIIHPRGVENAIGRFKNDLVYPRSSVRRAFSSDAWIRQGRSVKEGEEPCKILKKGGEDGSSLYGEWQTVAFEAQDLVDVNIILVTR
jgi:xeroderma pigmentosum group C-complementing protein